MKKIKMKDTILEHYRKVHEMEIDGLTVRVWKPRTMQTLPAYGMLEWIKERAKEAARYCIYEQKNDWYFGNPDFGMWDAQVVYHTDPRHKTFDIYIAAIIVRPYSREAYDFYCSRHAEIEDINQRLMLMFDSREYDRINGFDTSYGAYKNQDEADTIIYSVRDKETDIMDTTVSNYLHIVDDDDEDDPVKRTSLTLRKTANDEVEYKMCIPANEPTLRGGTKMMHAAAKCFYDFREEHPEVTEMRFYTDELVIIDDSGEEKCGTVNIKPNGFMS